MAYDPYRHHRRSTRLRTHDYWSEGPYFVTLCTQGRVCLFGEVQDGVLSPSAAGRMVGEAWQEIPKVCAGVVTDAFVVMPNHVHGILYLDQAPPGDGQEPYEGTSNVDERADPAERPTLGDIIRRLKTWTTRQYSDGVRDGRWPSFERWVWQRNYYDSVIRSSEGLLRVRAYIRMNPRNWEEDGEHPDRFRRAGPPCPPR